MLVSSLLISIVVGTAAHRSINSDAASLGLEVDGPKECTGLENYTTSGCLISNSPGACYVTTGKKWSCWAKDTPVKSDQECKDNQFAGACTFGGHGTVLTDDKIQDCTKLPFFKAQCNPPTNKWGACYTQGSMTNDGWLCVPDTDKDDIERYRRGDCQVQPVGPAANKRAYTDVCRFPKRQQPVYQCETVKPPYGPSNPKTTCGGGAASAACFSLDEKVTWSCQEVSSMNPSCVTTPVSVDPGSANYNGACLFQGAPGYENALVYGATPLPPTSTVAAQSSPTTSVAPSRTTPDAPSRTSSTSTHKGAAARAPGGVAMLTVLTALAVACVQ